MIKKLQVSFDKKETFQIHNIKQNYMIDQVDVYTFLLPNGDWQSIPWSTVSNFFFLFRIVSMSKSIINAMQISSPKMKERHVLTEKNRHHISC